MKFTVPNLASSRTLRVFRGAWQGLPPASRPSPDLHLQASSLVPFKSFSSLPAVSYSYADNSSHIISLKTRQVRFLVAKITCSVFHTHYTKRDRSLRGAGKGFAWFKSTTSSLVFCLDDPSAAESEVLKAPTIAVLSIFLSDLLRSA